MRVTTVGSPPGPAPSLCFRTILARTPFLRSTSAVPDVAQISNPMSASRLTGNTMARLSLFATDTNTRPLTGSDPYTASCDFPYAVPNIESIPITSPVERISGPSTVSTPAPEASRNRPNGSTASLTATGESSGSVPPSPSAGSIPDERSRLRQRHRGRLGHERYRPRGAWVRLEHVQHPRRQRVLDVQQTAHADPA